MKNRRQRVFTVKSDCRQRSRPFQLPMPKPARMIVRQSCRSVLVSGRTILFFFLQNVSIRHATTLPHWQSDPIEIPMLRAWSQNHRIGERNDTSLIRWDPYADIDLLQMVVPMPRTKWHQINVTSAIVEIRSFKIDVSRGLSGCEPKFDLRFDGNKDKGSSIPLFLFKPTDMPCKVLNELLAYHLDQLMETFRVPLVLPMKISYEDDLIPALRRWDQNPQKKLLNCNMDVAQDHAGKWAHVTDAFGKRFVIGSMQLRVPGILQREEAVRFIDRHLPLTATNSIRALLFPAAPSPFAQREKGTRAVFDYLTGNIDRYNNDHIGVVGENKVLAYIDNNRLSTMPQPFNIHEGTEDCRFYFDPIQKLLKLADIGQQYTMGEANSAFAEYLYKRLLHHQPQPHGSLVQEWLNSSNPILHYDEIPVFQHLRKRVHRVYRRVTECIEGRGFYHVFVEH